MKKYDLLGILWYIDKVEVIRFFVKRGESMSSSNVKIILVDHHSLFRTGIKQILEKEEKFKVVAEGETVDDVYRLMNSIEADILLIDISSNSEQLFSRIHLIKEEIPNCKVIFMSAQRDEHNVLQALKVGASGYLLKEMNVDLFIDAIHAILNGTMWYHPEAMHYFLANCKEIKNKLTENPCSSSESVKRPLHLLTKRECEVLQLLSEGKSNEGIAKSLEVSESTVKNHVASILRKMNVSDRTLAAITAIKNRWVHFEYNDSDIENLVRK